MADILCMDKCVCVVHLFYTRVHEWFNATSLFCFCTRVSHGCAVKVVDDLYCIMQRMAG